jgi:hypothetical protein
MAAGYVGEKSVERFLAAVDNGEWPKPFKEHGSGKGKTRIWRRLDLNLALGMEPRAPEADGDLELEYEVG